MAPDRRSLDDVIAEYLDSRRSGNPPDPQTLLEEYPELRSELEAFLRDDAAIGLDVGALVDQQRVDAPTLEGERIGGYEVLGEIDRGSMGVVYRARDVALGREVALKVIARGELADEGEVERFRREARAVAARSTTRTSWRSTRRVSIAAGTSSPWSSSKGGTSGSVGLGKHR